MKKDFFKNALFLLWFIILLIFFLKIEKPVGIPLDKQGDSGFDISNVEGHIIEMASEKHFIGTDANRKVRDYILNNFAELKIPAEVFVGHSEDTWYDSYKRMGRTENIIARIKGSNSTKSLFLCAHYDSVLDCGGAADDIHAVACMLEVARIVKDSKPLNDIVFLITDGEEMGLLGAKAYVENKDLEEIGLILNYEARGNSGPSISFEWSDGNAWLVEQLSQVGINPIANSMSYEIYKVLPNDTDYSYFKEAEIPGINHAFIDGFSYYHNPVDDPEHINMNSVYHTGINMLSLCKHFSNQDLSNVISHNASFFNFFGKLISYRSSFDVFILGLSWILIFLVLYIAIKTKKSKITELLISLVFNFVIIVIVVFSVWLLQLLLPKLYPHYFVFYSGQFYNHKWYLLVTVFLSFLILSFLYRLFLEKGNAESFQMASLILMGILAVVVYLKLPTAAYVMTFPLIALAIYKIVELKWAGKKVIKVLPYIFILFPLSFWVLTTHNLFLAFSLKMLIGPAFLICIIGFCLIILNNSIWAKSKIIIPVCILGFLLSMIGGHLTSQPTSYNPLPSSLYLVHDVDTQKSFYMTDDKKLNEGHKSLMPDPELKILKYPYNRQRLHSPTDFIPEILTFEERKDTLDQVEYKLRYEDEVFFTRAIFDNLKSISSLNVNGQDIVMSNKTVKALTLDFYGYTQDSLYINIIKTDSLEKIGVNVESRFLKWVDEDVLPEYISRTDGFTAINRKIEL